MLELLCYALLCIALRCIACYAMLCFAFQAKTDCFALHCFALHRFTWTASYFLHHSYADLLGILQQAVLSIADYFTSSANSTCNNATKVCSAVWPSIHTDTEISMPLTLDDSGILTVQTCVNSAMTSGSISSLSATWPSAAGPQGGAGKRTLVY